jgi:hypothetical protein
MRVDFSEWYTAQPGLVARRYTYSQLKGARDFDLEIRFNIQAGLSIYTFINLLIHCFDLPQERVLIAALSPTEDRTARVPMAMIGTPYGESGAVLNIPSRDDVAKCLQLFHEGRDLCLEIEGTDGERLAMLPLPNDHAFAAAYRGNCDRVRSATAP